MLLVCHKLTYSWRQVFCWSDIIALSVDFAITTHFRWHWVNFRLCTSLQLSAERQAVWQWPTTDTRCWTPRPHSRSADLSSDMFRLLCLTMNGCGFIADVLTVILPRICHVLQIICETMWVLGVPSGPNRGGSYCRCRAWLRWHPWIHKSRPFRLKRFSCDFWLMLYICLSLFEMSSIIWLYLVS